MGVTTPLRIFSAQFCHQTTASYFGIILCWHFSGKILPSYLRRGNGRLPKLGVGVVATWRCFVFTLIQNYNGMNFKLPVYVKIVISFHTKQETPIKMAHFYNFCWKTNPFSAKLRKIASSGDSHYDNLSLKITLKKHSYSENRYYKRKCYTENFSVLF